MQEKRRSNMKYLTDFQQFADKQELNFHVKRHLDATTDDINATDRQVFKFIARYAVKYAGASHLKVATIAEYIERTDRATRNILAKLERLGMIARVSRNRPKTGGRGANIIIIKPFLELETSEPTSGLTSERAEADNLTDAKEPATNSEKEPLRKLAKNNTFVTNTYPTGVSTYSAVKQAITTFLGEDSQPTISRLYGVYLGQTKPLRATEYYSTEGKAELISAVITAIQETFKATKRIPIRNLAGYFNGVLSNKLDDLMAEAMQATGL